MNATYGVFVRTGTCIGLMEQSLQWCLGEYKLNCYIEPLMNKIELIWFETTAIYKNSVWSIAYFHVTCDITFKRIHHWMDNLDSLIHRRLSIYQCKVGIEVLEASI